MHIVPLKDAALGGEGVDMRGLDVGHPVASKLRAEVIDADEEDIGSSLGQEAGQEEKKEGGSHEGGRKGSGKNSCNVGS